MTARIIENGIIDHFEGAALDPTYWAGVAAGAGGVTVGNGYVDLNCPADTDAAFIYYKNKPSKTKHSIFRACIRAVTAPSLPDLIGLYRDVTAPIADIEANINDVLLAGVSLSVAQPYVQMRRYSGQGITPTINFQDFETLNDDDPISDLPDWEVDYGNARCEDDPTYGKTFQCFSAANFRSCYTRITNLTDGVDQWANYLVPEYTGQISNGPAFRMSGATGNRYYVRIRGSDARIEWARETGQSSFSLIERSPAGLFPSAGNYVGFSVEGTGSSTVVKYWIFTAKPSDDGPSAWGVPTWTSTQDPTNVGGQDYSVDTGNYLGMSYYFSTSGNQLIDNFTSGPFPGGVGPTFTNHVINGTAQPRVGANEDFYILGLEIDGTNAKLRGHLFHANKSSFSDNTQGLTMINMTDWEDIDPAVTEADFYFCIGSRYTNGYAGRWQIEWAYLEELDSTIYGLVNSANAGADGDYNIRKMLGYGTQWMPSDIGDAAIDLPKGGAGTWNDSGYRGKFLCKDSGVYYLFVEGSTTTFFSDAELGIYSKNNENDAWVYQTRLDPAVIIGAGYVDISSPWLIRDDTEIPGFKYKMLVMATQSSYSPKVFLLHSDNLTSGWAKYTGLGTDGAVIDNAGTTWRANGVNETTVTWDPVDLNYKAFVSGLKNSDPDRGWSIGIFESTDKWRTWSEAAGVTNPVIQQSGIRQSLTAVNGKTVTVTDGTPWTLDAGVCFSKSLHTGNVNYSRIRSIVGNDLELYHEIGGLDTTFSAEQVGQGSITSQHIYYSTVLSKWVLILTVFQPYVTTGDSADSELSGVYTADNIKGPWTQEFLQTFNVPRENSSSGAHASNENLRFLVEFEASTIINFIANIVGTTQTNDLSASILRDLGANIVGTTRTSDLTASITSLIDFVANVVGTTRTSDLSVQIQRNLLANVQGATQTSDISALIIRELNPKIQGFTRTSDLTAQISGVINFIANIIGSTQTSDLTAQTLRQLGANIQGNTQTKELTASLLRDLLASIAGVTQTSDLSAIIIRELAPKIQNDTRTSDLTAIIQGIVNFVANVVGTTQTSDLTPITQRILGANVLGTTVTSDLTGLLIRELNPKIQGFTRTSDLTVSLADLINFIANVQGITRTSDPSVTIARALTANIQGLTQTSDLTPITDRRLIADILGVTRTSDLRAVLGGLGAILDPKIESLTVRKAIESLTANKTINII